MKDDSRIRNEPFLDSRKNPRDANAKRENHRLCDIEAAIEHLANGAFVVML
jgi:hypothetical protein